MSETSIIVATATTDLSGDVISTPSELSTEVIVDTGDGLQRAIATANIEGTVVSETSDVNTECVVDTGDGLQRAIKVYNLSENGGAGGGGGSSTKYGATISTFLGDVDSNGVLQAPSEAADIVFSGVEDVDSHALIYAFGCGENATRLKINSVQFPDLTAVTGEYALGSLCRYSSTLTSVSFPKLKTISGNSALNGAMYNCVNLTSASFPELTTISGIQSLSSAFYYCTKLTSLSFPKLTTISGSYGISSAMTSCTGLTSVDLSALETIGGQGAQYMFNSCTSLTSVSFPKLKRVGNACLMYAFQNCTALTSVSFPALKSNSFVTAPRAYCFSNMLRNVSGCTVHFPSNLESLIGSEEPVTAGFGGTNTTVLFDLPATE